MNEIILVQTHVPIVFSKVGQEIGSPILEWLKEYWWIFAAIAVVVVFGFFLMKKDKPEPMVVEEPVKEKPPMDEIKILNKPYSPPTAT